MMMTNYSKYLLVVCMAFVSSMAVAEDFYVGAGAYAASINDSIDGAKVDDTNTAMAVFVGWRPIELVGVEAGYYDLGKYDIRSSTYQLDAKAYTLAGVLTFDMGPVGVYGKLGAAYSDLKVNGSSYSESSTKPFGALGAYVDVMDTFYVYAEAMRIQADVDIDMLGLGVRLAF
jgi:hypothetical protein